MTTLIVLTLVTITLILIAILVLYAIGKINAIEETTKQLMSPGEREATRVAENSAPFRGLDGKPLWDMLSGKIVPDGVIQSELEVFREQYAPVLLKAIKASFGDGLNDSKFGQPRANPGNQRLVKTLRLSINAWLPSHEVSSLYNAGYDSLRAQGDELERLRLTVSEVVAALFGKLQMPAPAGVVESLIGQRDQSVMPLADPVVDQIKLADDLSDHGDRRE